MLTFTPNSRSIMITRSNGGELFLFDLDKNTIQEVAKTEMEVLSMQFLGSTALLLAGQSNNDDGPAMKIYNTERWEVWGPQSSSGLLDARTLPCVDNIASFSKQGRVQYLAFTPGTHGTYMFDRNYRVFMSKIILVTVEGMRGFPCFFNPIVLPGNASEIKNLSFSPDGEFLTCVDENGQLMVWELHNKSYELNPSLYWRSSDSFFNSEVSMEQAKLSSLNRRLLEARIENYETPDLIISDSDFFRGKDEDDKKIE